MPSQIQPTADLQVSACVVFSDHHKSIGLSESRGVLIPLRILIGRGLMYFSKCRRMGGAGPQRVSVSGIPDRPAAPEEWHRGGKARQVRRPASCVCAQVLLRTPFELDEIHGNVVDFGSAGWASGGDRNDFLADSRSGRYGDALVIHRVIFHAGPCLEVALDPVVDGGNVAGPGPGPPGRARTGAGDRLSWLLA